ncbi:MAG: low specificity L-threonine aldolase [Rhodospirillaceae bacterium]|nr:low specificity L-threonine aldolase [Rhodospirillaceae bacterium]|tara:strand:- start:2054 stop:3076 length:1023 start_codon:yes stop_codon:yes gene_type:complete
MYDFYSDTKTKPSEAMRRTVLDCDVGDEQKDEDPTTTKLCSKVAELLGKEKALLLPSGTMCNEIAINIHTNPGDEIICEQSCHIINFETGAPAFISGVMIKALEGKNGIFDHEQVANSIRNPSRYDPRTSLLCVEQTSNMSGGTIWPLDKLNAVSSVAKKSGIRTHMDGARLLNACVKTGIDASVYAENFDSVWLDFSKGLGAPVGAVLAGSSEFILKAWRVKQQLGGAMRQSGIIASMCIYALENNVERLSEDHKLATFLGKEIGKLGLVQRVLPVETNIIIFDLSPQAIRAPILAQKLIDNGIKIGSFGDHRIRVVTHLDVNYEAGKRLIDCLRDYLS